MLSQTKCLLVLLACGWLALHLVAADGLKWKEFMCDDRQWQDVEYGIQFLVYVDKHLYFYFNNFVLKIERPTFEEVRDDSQNLLFQFLDTRVGTYISYEELQSRPPLMDLNPDIVTGFIHFASEMREKRSGYNLGVITEMHEPVEGVRRRANYSLNVFSLKLDESENALGEVGETDASAKERLGKQKFALGNVWVDTKKWLEIYYVRDYMHLSLYKSYWRQAKPDKLNRKPFGSAKIKSLGYLVSHVAFYGEYEDYSVADFKGSLFEVDGYKNVHLHNLQVSLMPNGALKVYPQDAQPIALAELLDCDVETITPRRFKGAFIYQYHPSGIVRSFVFADNYYFKSRWDLVQIKFNMALGRPANIKRVKFKNDRPLSERLSMKYIKNWGKKIYATFNRHQTYELSFRSKESKDYETLHATETNHKMNHCLGSTLTATQEDGKPYTFCFVKSHYYPLAAKENEINVENLKLGLKNSQLFKGRNITGDIEAIIWYKDHHQVVFMTYDYLYLFNRSSFVAKNGETHKYLAFQKSDPIKNYVRLRNCFWRFCDAVEELPYDKKDREDKKREVGVGINLFKLMLILLLVIGISWLVWFLVKHRPISKEAAKAKAKEKLDQVKALLKKAGLSDEWKQKLGLVKHQAEGDAAKKADQTAQKPGDELKKSKSLKSIGSPEKRSSPQLADLKTKQASRKSSKGSPV